MKKHLIITALIPVFMVISCSPEPPKVTPAEAREIAKEAYIYGFPMVVNYKTMYMYALDKSSP